MYKKRSIKHSFAVPLSNYPLHQCKLANPDFLSSFPFNLVKFAFTRELLFECSDQDRAVHEPVMLMKIVSAQLVASEGI